MYVVFRKTASLFHAVVNQAVSYFVYAFAAVMLLLVAALPFVSAANASDNTPRLVISKLELPANLSARERSVVKQIDFMQLMREALLDSRTFTVLAREDKTVQAIIHEKSVADSTLALDASNTTLGLKVAEYFLQMSLVRFDMHSHYEPMELLTDKYDRRDSVKAELLVLIYDAAGQIKFEERVKHSQNYDPVEADKESMQRNDIRHLSAIRKDAAGLVVAVASAITARINPIVVLDVQNDTLIIDRGKNNGFDEKTRLKVYAKSKQVEHPITGDMRVIPGAYIGEAKIHALHEDVAELSLIDGALTDVEPGAIVRVIKESKL